MAAAFKLKGNEAFKAGDYAAAIGAYTSAIMADPSDATFPLNRAAAYLKLAKYQDAERDCTRVLSRDPKNLKALFRRGEARAGQENFAAAKADLEQVLSLTPNDPAAKAELAKVQTQIENGKKKKRTKPIPDDIIPPTPYRRRVPIEIVDTKDTPKDSKLQASKSSEKAKRQSPPVEEISTPAVKAGGAAKNIQPTEKKTPLIQELPDPPNSTPSNPPQPTAPKSFQQAKEERLNRGVRTVGGGIMKRDGSHSNSIFVPKTVVSPSSEPTSATKPASESSTANGSKTSQPKNRSKPTNAFEFQRQWQADTDNESRWSVLQSIPPESLAIFFKNSMEPPLLASVFTALYTTVSQNPTTRDLVAAYTQNMKKIPRFDTLTLFFSDSEQKTMRQLTDLVDGL